MSNCSTSLRVALQTSPLFLLILIISSFCGLGLALPHQARAESTEKNFALRHKQSQVEKTGFSGLVIILAARFDIKPEKREEFLKLALAAVEQTVKEPGVVSYSLYEDPNTKNSFIFFEQWKSRRSLDIHLTTDYTKRLLDRFPDLVSGDPSIKVYRVKSIDFEF